MACREFEMGRVCIIHTKLSITHAGQYMWSFVCQISNCKNNLPDGMRMPVLIFVRLENSECDCFAPFIVLLHYLGDTSVKYSCLYTELYQWSVSGQGENVLLCGMYVNYQNPESFRISCQSIQLQKQSMF